jgi:hypothetical protein
MGIIALIFVGMVLEHFLKITGKAIDWVNKKIN